MRLNYLIVLVLVLFAKSDISKINKNKEPDRIFCFVGNSITNGYAREDIYDNLIPYSQRIVLAKDGASVSFIANMFDSALTLNPAKIALMAGTNNLASNPDYVVDYISQMLEKAKENNVKVVLATLPPVKEAKYKIIKENLQLCMNNHKEINDFIRKSVEIYDNVVVVDLFDSLSKNDIFKSEFPTPDGLHPGKEGRAKIREIVFKAMLNDN